MYVIKKLYLKEYQIDSQFPNLNRFPKEEVIQTNVDNPHVVVSHWRTNNQEENVRYVIGKEK